MLDGTGVSTAADETAASATSWMARLGTLMEELEASSAAAGAPAPVVTPQIDNQLVQVRLGMAQSLFTALKLKHAPMAAHALRIALSGSAWCVAMELDDGRRDAIELSALLHDVGMIGVPDRILHKPGPLDADESRVVERARAMTLEILRSSCAEPALLEIVENVSAWYDGSHGPTALAGADIPLGARMIAILEAFDAMTTDHVFRPAMSRERAAAELFNSAGTQFDPELVRQFIELDYCDHAELRRAVAARWLDALSAGGSSRYWQWDPDRRSEGDSPGGSLFQARLLDNMHDAVVFVDGDLRVTQWNRGAERLTGVTGESAQSRQWSPGLLDLRNERGVPIAEDDCPVLCAVRSGTQSLRRLRISGRAGRAVSVDSHTIPVVADNGSVQGAILLLHDASPETSLEERCQSLHEKATKDPLTQVANRAEFDRVHAAFVKQHKQEQVPCSLIICDLDRFKLVNDTYGHQAGDEAIQSLATLMKNACRPGDLVARYGGEEFVMLCADCDNAAGSRRAEQLRQALGQTPQSRMEGRSVTASFGVTEIQPGDTAETMLRRADRALLMAKAQGRNTVVQLGSGSSADARPDKPRLWKRKTSPGLAIEQALITPVPLKMAIEKLRGFVADRRAKILNIDGNQVKLQIEEDETTLRRRSDRPMTFIIEAKLEQQQFEQPRGQNQGTLSRTKIHVTITPRRNRDRRRNDVIDRGRDVLASFRSYLMATEETPATTRGVLEKARWIFAPWLSRKDER